MGSVSVNSLRPCEKATIILYICSHFTGVVASGPIDDKFVQVMAWHRTGDRPLFKPMMALFTEA